MVAQLWQIAALSAFGRSRLRCSIFREQRDGWKFGAIAMNALSKQNQQEEECNSNGKEEITAKFSKKHETS